jgi:hypothetical protein
VTLSVPYAIIGFQRRNGSRLVERFIHNENIRRFRKLLEEEPNEEKRNAIRKLLAEEEAREISASPKRNSENTKIPNESGARLSWRPLFHL